MENALTERRIGKVFIRMEIIQNFTPEELKVFCENFGIVVGFDNCYVRNGFEYTIAHPEFCKLFNGQVAPEYLMEFITPTEPDGKIVVNWRIVDANN